MRPSLTLYNPPLTLPPPPPSETCPTTTAMREGWCTRLLLLVALLVVQGGGRGGGGAHALSFAAVPAARAFVSIFLASSVLSPSAPRLGVSSDLLLPCDSSGACYSTQDDRPDIFCEPWTYDDDTKKVMSDLFNLLSGMRGVTILEEGEGGRYLRAIADKGAVLGVSDWEFYATPGDTTIQFRVNSRSGTPDFGENKRAMERIRIALRLEKVPVLRSFTFFGGYGPSGYLNELELSPEQIMGRRPGLRRQEN
jgi:uncharacterized protein (DUF1499 family)